MHKKKTFLVLMTLAITCSLFFTANVIGETEEVNNNVFSPLSVSKVSYDIYNMAGQNLATIDGQTSDFAVWRDPTYRYPIVDIVRSDPFLVDQSGLIPVLDPAKEMVNPNTLEVKTFGNELLYLKKFYVAVDLAVRTYSNMPALQYYTIPISPLDNFYLSHAGRNDYNAFSSLGSSGETNSESDWNKYWNAGTYDSPFGGSGNTRPTGVLLGVIDCGVNPWSVTWALRDVAIQNSLQPLTITSDSLRDTTSLGNDLSTAMTNLDNNYGNSRVIVKPNISIEAINDLIKYDYIKTLPNGTKIHVETTSSKMGFFNVKPVQGLQKFGLVENNIDEEIDELGIRSTVKDDEAAKETPEVTLPSDKQAYQTSRGYEAHFTYTNTVPETLGGGARIYSTIKTNVQPQQIDINNFVLPNKAWAMIETELEPVTIAKIAKYNMKYAGWYYDGAWPDMVDNVIQGTKTIAFPYRLEITNVYAVQRFVYEVAVLTSNKLSIIPTEGEPIEIEDIGDFDVNGQGVLPDYNDVSGSIVSTSFDWLAMLRDAFSGGLNFVIWIVIGIVAIAGIFVVVKLVPQRRD